MTSLYASAVWIRSEVKKTMQPMNNNTARRKEMQLLLDQVNYMVEQMEEMDRQRSRIVNEMEVGVYMMKYAL